MAMAMEECVMIPGLPNEVAMLCLARLPFGLHPLLSCVCRSWRRALHLPLLFHIRARLGLQEHFLFVMVPAVMRKQRSRSSTHFYLIDTRLAKCYPLPPPPRVRGYPYASGFDCDVITLGQQVLIFVRPYSRSVECDIRPWLEDCPESWEPLCFDAVSRLWCTLSTPMLESRFKFASATVDGYVYVAGGETLSDTWNAKSAERFDLASKRWERIPDMTKSRCFATAMAWKGSFYMVGGSVFTRELKSIYQDSAEVWDALKEEWQLIPGFLPKYYEIVANVKGKLYTLNAIYEQVMLLDEKKNNWIRLGSLPYESRKDGKYEYAKYKLIGAGDELCVLKIVFHKCTFFFTDPESLPLCWRLLPLRVEEDPNNVCLVTL